MDETEVDALRTIRANYIAQLVGLSDPTKRKPTYSMGGRSVGWVEYQTFLHEKIQSLSDTIDGEAGSPLILTAGD